MSAIALRQALGRAAWALGARAQSTAAASAASATQKLGEAQIFPSDDPIMQPYYQKLTKLKVVPATTPKEASPSELRGELEMFRLHNSSLPTHILEGHMIRAQIVEMGRRTVTLDTGLLPARVARSDLSPECVVGTTAQGDDEPRSQGELREGDVVQVFLESVGTLEGDMLVSGVQAAAVRRMASVWNELEERHKRGEVVKGRVLNAIYRGFAVGVAGVVAFLPAWQCSRSTSRRLGQLQKFRILSIDRSRNSLVVADSSIKQHSTAGSSSTAAWQPRSRGSATKRPPRNEEEAERRQELARVADELRSVLALRGGK